MKRTIFIILFAALCMGLQSQSVLRAMPFARAQVVASGDTLGPEMLTNGTFTTTDYWTYDGYYDSWEITGGVCRFLYAGGAGGIEQAAGDMVSNLEASTTYRLEFDFDIADGSYGWVYFANAADGVTYKSAAAYYDGHIVVRFTTPSDIGAGGFLIWAASFTNYNYTFDNISLKKVL